ncbi:MAG: hypothetical protein R3246_16935, partial [Acidimicrobiia bacterium]|nr:hypothetical protein [Acidimicrobiia bacterium]
MSRVGRLLTALALVFVALPLLTAAGGGNGTADEARAEHQRIIDFWTPERVAQAVPRDIVFDVALGRFRLANPAHHRPGHAGGPGGGDPGGDTGDAVTGASWTGGGTIADTEGKVLFQLGVDGNGQPQFWVCSATVVTDSRSGESLVLT